ncbi:polysaccharide pyruvyl transferase family protein [Burkholderia sp. Bp9017]|uniref:Polysaccharide pyruvyl transferase family protein n=1 Tax=Burkholderia anthina TaxID=179879 RepID=A0A7T6VLA7_9BURK|nr:MULTISPECIES: polysaccharide pyruvyl transferase family protein [Burkholderia]MBY4869749.1 polysaccharide pyruvyl transferase family protein [Burkholderia anthina]QQK06040.1 polysaccharide pyruvyl transferase family protein [Burkholderia anthina]RQZ16458.1 polysaccharide pyruvyl transferase family protein [Burkholderia sp. Bp9017]RQZ27453.1 polysaccharide pyruvyl transferase family protein [Burkholderia sp. Bp9016]
MTSSPHIALLHAYSTRNSGDGLLVDLSVGLLREAFGNATRVSIVAADPASFPAYDDVRAAPVLADRGWRRLTAAAGAVLHGRANGRLRPLGELLGEVDLVVGVGGGYLRARNTLEAIKLEAGHLLQMRAARASGKPAVYLPQSIGPVMSARTVDAHLQALLASFDTVFVRDDRSAACLAAHPNVRRAPDLAVLDFAHRHGALAPPADGPIRHVAFVLRHAPAWSKARRNLYDASIAQLVERVRGSCRVSFAVQSTGRGNDDPSYYRSLGIEDALVPFKTLLAHDRPDAAVSVRLHGALESILHGVPAFHIAYERKGFGAYADLRLDDWVVNGADFDPSRVTGTLLADGAAKAFWCAAYSGLAPIRAARARVIDALRAALDTGRTSRC